MRRFAVFIIFIVCNSCTAHKTITAEHEFNSFSDGLNADIVFVNANVKSVRNVNLKSDSLLFEDSSGFHAVSIVEIKSITFDDRVLGAVDGFVVGFFSGVAVNTVKFMVVERPLAGIIGLIVSPYSIYPWGGAIIGGILGTIIKKKTIYNCSNETIIK